MEGKEDKYPMLSLEEQTSQTDVKRPSLKAKSTRIIVKEDKINDRDRYDYVIMFDKMTEPLDKEGKADETSKNHIAWAKRMAKIKNLTKKLRGSQGRRKTVFDTKGREIKTKPGLHVSRRYSKDREILYLLIGASEQRLECQAEYMELSMRMKKEAGAGYGIFTRARRDLFEMQEDVSRFRSGIRIALIESIISGDIREGGAGINLRKKRLRGVVSNFYALHDKPRLKELLEEWAKPKNFYKPQPMDKIRNYFGEEIAFYFAWLGFYTQMLLLASVVGAITTVFWGLNIGKPNNWSIWIVTLYSIFLALWATLFLEYWKRKNNTLAFEWGVLDFEDVVAERPEFLGEESYGTYYEGEWITFEPDEKFTFPLPKAKYYPTMTRRSKMGSALPLMVFVMMLVAIATVSVLSFRLFVQKAVQSIVGSVVGGICNAVIIILLNTVWNKVALKLTDWENHRTDIEWSDAFIVKTFAFQFVNSYVSLYYIAFFKRSVKLWGVDYLADGCKTTFGPGQGVGDGCMDEVTFQLITLLLTNMFIGQAREIGIPWLMSKLKFKLFERSEKKEHGEDALKVEDLEEYEKQGKLGVYSGTIDEYSEMVIQYGYITLFAASFPLAPFLAVLNNIVEIRTDALKLITSMARPSYKGAKDIGTWYNLLEIVGYVSVITNSFLIGFTFKSTGSVFTGGDTHFKALAFTMILEHVIILFKFLLAYIVPDVPGDIKKALSKQNYVRDNTLKALDGGIKLDWLDDGWRDKEGEESDPEEGAKGKESKDSKESKIVKIKFSEPKEEEEMEKEEEEKEEEEGAPLTKSNE